MACETTECQVEIIKNLKCDITIDISERDWSILGVRPRVKCLKSLEKINLVSEEIKYEDSKKIET